MAVVSISVRTLQQGLHKAAADNPRVPSPGVIDGVWGSRTRASLDTLRGELGYTAEVRYGDIPPGVVSVVIERQIATLLEGLAAEYRSLPSGREPTAAAVNAATADRVRSMTSATSTTLPFPAATLVAPTGQASSSWLPVLLGLGAAVVIFGGGYWLYTRSRGRGRRRR